MNEQLEIENYGRVKTMQFPAGWLQDKNELNEHSISQIISVHHPDFEKVQFGFYNRGRAINRYIALEFITVLQMSEHTLTPYEEEVVEPILRTLADTESFKQESIKTVLLNGTCVLQIEGLWLRSGLQERGYFFNVDERAEFVQELHFFAPVSEFERFLPQISKCLDSIAWHPEYCANPTT